MFVRSLQVDTAITQPARHVSSSHPDKWEQEPLEAGIGGPVKLKTD